MPDMNVLEGLRVVEGSAFVAAPLGGMALAQLGADVDPLRCSRAAGSTFIGGHARMTEQACSGPG